jgi:hypothetical protein
MAKRIWQPPDWTDKTQYPDPHNASALQWAWEFLRRNPEYQRLWSEVIQSEYKPSDLDDSLRKAGSLHPRLYTRRAAYADEPVAAQFKFLAEPPPPPYATFREKFHILTYPPPPWENKAKLYFDAQFIPAQAGPSTAGTGRVRWPVGQNEIVIWFNLSWPLSEQLRNAKKLLQAQAAKHGTRTPGLRRWEEKYRTYLRLLDAIAAGATPECIVSTLYDKIDNSYPDFKAKRHMRDDRQAAERRRDKDFWRIAVTAQESKVKK